MSIIKLNVGGIKFTTLKMTLDKHESFLSSLVSERHSVIKDEEGYIFIDRNGEIFKYIMKWLRGYEIAFHKMESTELLNLYTDCKYYCISLADEIKSYYDIIFTNIFHCSGSTGKNRCINLNNDYINTYITLKKEDNSNYEFIVLFMMYYDSFFKFILLEYNNNKLLKIYCGNNFTLKSLKYNKFINYYYKIYKENIIIYNGEYMDGRNYIYYKYDHNSNKKININDSDHYLDIKLKNEYLS